MNLGSEEEVKEIRIGALLDDKIKPRLIELLKEYVDVFAWSYQDMPGLDTDIVEHRLPLKPECPPVKQKLRRTHPNTSYIPCLTFQVHLAWHHSLFFVIPNDCHS